jgi:CRISPR/Cas system-associated endonuclease Cas1
MISCLLAFADSHTHIHTHTRSRRAEAIVEPRSDKKNFSVVISHFKANKSGEKYLLVAQCVTSSRNLCPVQRLSGRQRSNEWREKNEKSSWRVVMNDEASEKVQCVVVEIT